MLLTTIRKELVVPKRSPRRYPSPCRPGKDQIAGLPSDRFGYDCTMGLSALQR